MINKQFSGLSVYRAVVQLGVKAFLVFSYHDTFMELTYLEQMNNDEIEVKSIRNHPVQHFLLFANEDCDHQRIEQQTQYSQQAEESQEQVVLNWIQRFLVKGIGGEIVFFRVVSCRANDSHHFPTSIVMTIVVLL